MFRRFISIVQANIRHSLHSPTGTRQKESHQHVPPHPEEEEYRSSYKNTSSNKSDRQLIEDLQLFGLSPPSSLKEATAARNREMQKFHPDRFARDPEKSETATEIALMYNAAFERLREHYRKG